DEALVVFAGHQYFPQILQQRFRPEQQRFRRLILRLWGNRAVVLLLLSKGVLYRLRVEIRAVGIAPPARAHGHVGSESRRVRRPVAVPMHPEVLPRQPVTFNDRNAERDAAAASLLHARRFTQVNEEVVWGVRQRLVAPRTNGLLFPHIPHCSSNGSQGLDGCRLPQTGLFCAEIPDEKFSRYSLV